jgi:hypothetical protein
MKTYYEQAVEAAEKMRQSTPGTPTRQGWRDEVLALTALAQIDNGRSGVAIENRGDSIGQSFPAPAPIEPLRRFDVERHPTAVLGAVGIFEPIDIRILNDGRVEVRRPDDQGKDWTTIFDPDTLDLASDIPDEEPLVEVPVAPAEVIAEQVEEADVEEADVDEFFGDEAPAPKKGKKK